MTSHSFTPRQNGIWPKALTARVVPRYVLRPEPPKRDLHTNVQACLGKIAGAKHISLEELEQRGGLSDHIRTLKQQQQ